MSMEKEMFQREQGFRVCLLIIRDMREKGILTDAEFDEAQTLLVKKYNPPISSLSLEKLNIA